MIKEEEEERSRVGVEINVQDGVLNHMAVKATCSTMFNHRAVQAKAAALLAVVVV